MIARWSPAPVSEVPLTRFRSVFREQATFAPPALTSAGMPHHPSVLIDARRMAAWSKCAQHSEHVSDDEMSEADELRRLRTGVAETSGICVGCQRRRGEKIQIRLDLM
jgi:mRNA-degrading endonuclease toxin of MazEF toxin-antitoxin module